MIADVRVVNKKLMLYVYKADGMDVVKISRAVKTLCPKWPAKAFGKYVGLEVS